MERIAPLAKILAEANGIEWQKLPGTGEGGMIVEQDILNYLSRIMSGEEEPPATPVDLPPPDWTGSSVPSADMLKGAGVDSDIAAFVEQSRSTSPQIPAMTPSASLEQDALEFELDDEEDLSAPAPQAPATSAFSAPTPEVPPVAEVKPAPAWDWNAPAAQSMPAPAAPMPEISVPAVSVPEISVPEVAAPSFSAPSFAAPEAPVAAHTSTADAGAAIGGTVAAAGLGSLLSRLYHKEPESAAIAPAAHTEEHSAPVIEAPVAEAPAFNAPSPSEFSVPGTTPLSTPASAPAFVEPAPAEVHVPAVEPTWQEPKPEWDAPQSAVAAPESAAPQVAEPEVHEAEPQMAAHHEPGIHHQEEEAPVEAAQHEPEPSHAEAAAEPQHPEQHRTEEQPHTEPEAAPAVAAAPKTERPASVPGEAVWLGTYLRRDANVAPISDLRGQLSSALERDVPLAFLVARAAQRHADTLGLSSVAIQDTGLNRARSVSGSPLRDAVNALDTDHDGTPDLLIVDAGSLDMDDLHYPHTATLSVGRVQDGRAALTLNGDLDAARAAQFLAQVAGTLEQPIVLVL